MLRGVEVVSTVELTQSASLASYWTLPTSTASNMKNLTSKTIETRSWVILIGIFVVVSLGLY